MQVYITKKTRGICDRTITTLVFFVDFYPCTNTKTKLKQRKHSKNFNSNILTNNNYKADLIHSIIQQRSNQQHAERKRTKSHVMYNLGRMDLLHQATLGMINIVYVQIPTIPKLRDSLTSHMRRKSV